MLNAPLFLLRAAKVATKVITTFLNNTWPLTRTKILKILPCRTPHPLPIAIRDQLVFCLSRVLIVVHRRTHLSMIFLGKKKSRASGASGRSSKSRMPDDWRALDHKVNHSTFSRRRGESTHPALQDSVSRTQSSPSLAHAHRLPSLPDISDSEGLWTEGMSPLDTWCSASSDGESEHQHVSARRILIPLLFMNLAARRGP